MKELIFTTHSNPGLAQSVAKKSGAKMGKADIGRFIDGEVSIRLRESVKNCEVYVLGSSFPPADNLLELLILINTLKINGSKKINVLMPYFGYGRSDYQYKPGTPINARLMAKLIEVAGAEKIVAIDLHSNKIKKFFGIPVINLSATRILASFFLKKDNKNLAVATPDKGGIKRAKQFAKILGINSLIKIEKYRPRPEEARVVKISGNVKNKNVIIIDDMIQSGNTIIQAAKALKSRGAKKVFAAVTHMASSPKSIRRLSKTRQIQRFIITDTVAPLIKHLPEKFKLLKLGNLLAKSVK